MRGIYIYSLNCPKNNTPKYIGKSINPKRRFYAHINDKVKSPKTSWIKGLKNENIKPLIEIVDIVDEDEWQFWEMYYIALYKSWGFELKNISIGGDGCNGSKGRKLSEEHKLKIGEGNKGKKPSDETKKIWSEQRKGRKQTLETILKKSETMKSKNIKISDEHKLKLIEISKNRVVSDITKEKLRVANLNKKQSKETIEKRRKSILETNSKKFKKIAKISINGEILIVYDTIGILLKEENFKHSGEIYQCCIGNKKTYKGYRWSYFDTLNTEITS